MTSLISRPKADRRVGVFSSLFALRRQILFSHRPGGQPPTDQGLKLISRNGITVKVASGREVKRFIKIRGSVFGKEYHGNKINKKDTDVYDQHAQQIILVDDQTDTIMGGCRVIMSQRTEDYYCHLEYDLTELMSLQGDKLEISQVCVHPKFRDGKNFALLWRGLVVYATWLQARYLFGIPSIKTTSREDMEKFYQLYEDLGHTGPILGITRPEFLKFSSGASLKEISADKIPTLMRLYFSGGGKVCSKGAVYHDLKCLDYLMVLDMDELHPRYQKWQNDAFLIDAQLNEAKTQASKG